MEYDADLADDVKSQLSWSDFAVGAADPVKRSIICSRVAAEVARLMPSARLTISPTSVVATTGNQTVRWHMKPDCSLTVSVPFPSFLGVPCTSALTST